MKHLKWPTLVVLSLILVACSSGATPPSPTPPSSSIARIEITPSALLLTKAGETYDLTAQAYNALGEPVDADLVWSSNNEAVVKVEDSGRVTSLQDLGSAQATVKAQGVEANPVLVLIAAPAPNAVLVKDEQILDGPTFLNPELDSIIGLQTSVLLAGAPELKVGTVLLARESAPLAGKVVSATPEGNHQRVVVETVPIDEVFQAFRFDETFRMTEHTLTPESLPGDVTVSQEPDGQLAVTYTPTSGLSLQASRFECDGSAAHKVKVETFSLTYKYDLTVSFTGDKPFIDNVQTMDFKVSGESSVSASGGLFIEAGLGGSMSCTLKLASVALPVTGVLSPFISPGLELIGELKIDGSVTAVTVEAGLKGKVGVQLESGFSYRANSTAGEAQGYTPIFSITPIFDLAPTYKAPSVYDAHLKVGVSVGPVLKLQARGITIGNRSLLSLDLVQGSLGLRGDIDLKHYQPQITDTSYASAYDLKIRGEIGTGDGISRMLEALSVPGSFEGVKLTWDSEPLASSPTGSLSLDRSQAMPGDEVTFTVNLQNVTIPFFGDNVKEVQLYVFKDRQEPQLLTTILPSASNQPKYTYSWTVPPKWSGEYKLAAVVNTWLADGLPLEIAQNSTQTLTVGGVCIGFPSSPDDPGTPGDPGQPGDPGNGDGNNSSCTGGANWSLTTISRKPPGPGTYISESHYTVDTSGMEFIYDEEMSNSEHLELRLVKGTVTVSGRVYQEHNGPTDPEICETIYPPTTRTLTDAGDDPNNSILGSVIIYTQASDYWSANSYHGGGSALLEVPYTTTCTSNSYSGTTLLDVLIFRTPTPLFEEVPVVQPGGILQGNYIDNDTIFASEDERVDSSSWLFTMPGTGSN